MERLRPAWAWVVAVAALVLVAAGPVLAAGTAEVERAREVARAAGEAVSGAERPEAIEALRALVAREFALEALTDFMAGPLGTPSPAQRARLRGALQRYATCALYEHRAGLAALEVEPGVRTSRGGAALVRARGEASGTVDWLLVDEAGRPAVMDVRVDGGWLLGGRRAELVSLFRQSGEDFDAFLDALEAKPATRADCG